MDPTAEFRARLGGRLVLWSTIALVVLGAIVMLGAAIAEAAGSKGQVLAAAQILYSSLLPMFATWVGTILAFYYTKENFEAATRGTLDLVRSVSQTLSATPLADKMMPRAKIVTETIPAGKSVDDLSISALERRFDQIGSNGQRISRLLLVDDSGACLGILHRALLGEMLAAGLRDAPPIDPAKDSLGKLLSKASPLHSGLSYRDVVLNSLAYVSKDRTVADAKAAMEQKPGCQDVIVTTSGSGAEPMLGWISNVDISRLLQA